MDPRSSPGNDEIAQLTHTALHALAGDALVVLDERVGPSRLVTSATSRTLPAHRLGEVQRVVDVLTRAGSLGTDARAGVLSAALGVDPDQPIGTMQVVYAEGAPPPGDRRVGLAQAFARHLGIMLATSELGGDRGAPDELETALVALEELARSSRAIERMTAALTAVARALTGATAAAMLVWDRELDTLRALPGAFGSADRALAASVTGPATNLRSSAARVFTTGRPYVANRASGDPGALREYIEKFRIERALWYPLTDKGRRVGVLILANKPSDFTPGDVALVEGVSARIARAVETGRSMSRVRVQRRFESILSTTAVAIVQGKSVEESLRPALERLRAVTNASVVALVPRDGPPLVAQASGAGVPLEERFMRDARALSHRSSGALPRSPGDPGWAALHVPVELYGGRTGALSLLRRNGEPFRRAEEAMLSRVANLAALAWATDRHRHQLAEIARMRERERIADELHDRVAQILFAAQLGLDSLLEGSTLTDTDQQRVVEVRTLLTKGDAAIRNVIHQLGSLLHTGAAQRIRAEVETIEEEFGTSVQVDVVDHQVDRASDLVADCLVKVAREALVNAAKHAGTCRISLTASGSPEGSVELNVLDDGIGLPEQAKLGNRFGLSSLRRSVADAGGVLEVTRESSGRGTRVRATFPA